MTFSIVNADGLRETGLIELISAVSGDRNFNRKADYVELNVDVDRSDTPTVLLQVCQTAGGSGTKFFRLKLDENEQPRGIASVAGEAEPPFYVLLEDQQFRVMAQLVQQALGAVREQIDNASPGHRAPTGLVR